MSEALALDCDFPPPAAPGARGAFFYRCYGLVVRSELALPELVAAEPAVADVEIGFSSIARPRPAFEASIYEVGHREANLAWGRVGAFRITGGSRIEIDPVAGVDPKLIAFPLLGPVIACLLDQRGSHVLHASAVSVAGRGAVLMGDKGAGKSTTAGLLVSAGHRLLADDVVALEISEAGRATMMPGFPQLKLADAAAAALQLAGAQVLDMVDPAIGKRQHRLGGSFGSGEIEAGRLYVLERGAEAGIEMLDPQAALKAAMRFSYMPRIDRTLFAGGPAGGAFFRGAVALARLVGVARLRVPDGLDRLGKALELIERDLASAGGDAR